MSGGRLGGRRGQPGGRGGRRRAGEGGAPLRPHRRRRPELPPLGRRHDAADAEARGELQAGSGGAQDPEDVEALLRGGTDDTFYSDTSGKSAVSVAYCTL